MVSKKLISLLMIVLGALLAGFSVACILLPNDAIDYGTAGIAIIINKATGFNLSLCVLFVFLPFLIAGLVTLGKEFFLKALLGSAVYTLGLEFFSIIPFELNTEHFLAVAFGGALLGTGLSLILRSGGCIDGSEILANILVDKISEKRKKPIGMTGILIAFNALVYLAAFIVIDRDGALLSILVYVVATSIIDRMTDHFDAIKQVNIITKEPGEIIDRIKNELKKTCTIMSSQGAISGENTTLICYVSYFELNRLREIVSDYKGSAFVTVTTVDEII